MNKRTQVIIFLVLVMAILTFVRSVLIINSYFLSLELDVNQEELKEEKRINYLLKEKILSISSLAYIERQARKRGFVDAQYIFLH